MSQSVSDHLLERLAREWRVKRIYGYPGDGINGIIGAFAHDGPRPEFVQVRHEEMAAFMACAHAKFTGEVDRKSTRLNSSHVKISYAVFCLKKKKRACART